MPVPSPVTTSSKILLFPRRAAQRVLRTVKSAGFALLRPYYVARRTTRRATLGPVEQDQAPVVLFLAAEAGLTPYYTGLALLARTLTQSGHQAMVLSCGGALPHCNVKSAMGGRADRRLCGLCRDAALRLGDKFDLADISLESLVGDAEKAEIAAIIARSGKEPWTLAFGGIAFGEFAQGESLRARRKLDVSEFDAADHADLLATLVSALRVYFAIRKLTARFNIRRIVYYGAYAHWLPVVMYARSKGIATTQIEHGYNRDIDTRLLNLRPAPVHEQQMNQTARWPHYRNIPLDPATVQMVAESGLFRLSNHGRRSTHSPNFERREHNILEEFGLSPDRKTLVAYSSSADELSAARHIYRGLGIEYGDAARPFPDSNAWLTSLIAWAGNQPDLQLIVRLHPRMATPAGKPLSVEEQGLRNLLTIIPDNVRIVWPRDKVSSYNLAEVADTVLVSWSTIGLELSRFGVPVIAAFSDRGSFAVGSFIGFEPTAEGYFSAIRNAIGRPASYELIAEAIRWTHFLFLSPTVSFAESVPSDDFAGVPDWKMPADREKIVGTLIGGEDASERRMAELPCDSGAVLQEREAVRRAVAYFIIYFMTGQDAPEGQIETVSALPGNVVMLSYRGKIYRYQSPLAHRLAVLLNSGASAVPFSNSNPPAHNRNQERHN
jgi:hypothetical protein